MSVATDVLDHVYAEIPELILESLRLYALRGVPPGSFLQAVLSNDLFDAVARADGYGRVALYQICTYVENELPPQCWGSRDKVETWISSKLIEGRSLRAQNV